MQLNDGMGVLVGRYRPTKTPEIPPTAKILNILIHKRFAVCWLNKTGMCDRKACVSAELTQFY